MHEKFSQMAERIINESNLEISGGKLEQAIINEANYNQEAVQLYLGRFQPIWEKWVSLKGSYLISPFLEFAGSYIFTEFLTEIFSFDSKLKVVVKKGASNVDANIDLFYIFDAEELWILKNLKEKYNINHIVDESEMAKILLSNCTKCLTRFLSNIMNIRYRLFTSQVETNLKPDNTLEINIHFDGRIG
ncbi:MAG: hypothetical protein ACFFCM_21355 [Promethearchaeota archaeon]